MLISLRTGIIPFFAVSSDITQRRLTMKPAHNLHRILLIGVRDETGSETWTPSG
jgi:hypothetical protein